MIAYSDIPAPVAELPGSVHALQDFFGHLPVKPDPEFVGNGVQWTPLQVHEHIDIPCGNDQCDQAAGDGCSQTHAPDKMEKGHQKQNQYAKRNMPEQKLSVNDVLNLATRNENAR